MACLLALDGAKCQSSEVRSEGPVIVVEDAGHRLEYAPRRVTLDGHVVEHESRGGTLSAAWAAEVGSLFVEVAHLGDGPEGGELVMVVTRPGHSPDVALGALVTDDIPSTVPESWPAAVDLALGLIVDGTLDSGSKDDVEAFHQRLLGVWFGHG